MSSDVKAEFFPKMQFAERALMLAHMHFHAPRVQLARVKVAKRIAAKDKRTKDLQVRLAEYDTTLTHITETWTAAPDAEREAAHELISQRNANGDVQVGRSV